MCLIYQCLDQLCSDALSLISGEQFNVAQKDVRDLSHDADDTDVLCVEHNDLAGCWVKVLLEVMRLPGFVPLSPSLHHIFLHRGAVKAIEEIGVVRGSGSQNNIHACLLQSAPNGWCEPRPPAAAMETRPNH